MSSTGGSRAYVALSSLAFRPAALHCRGDLASLSQRHPFTFVGCLSWAGCTKRLHLRASTSSGTRSTIAQFGADGAHFILNTCLFALESLQCEFQQSVAVGHEDS